jgi:cytoplasmic FMR1 interacting protein
VAGCLRNFSEQLQWASAYDGFNEMLQNLKEIGSLVFWMSLLDTAMRQVETVHFMQVVPWLGVVPNKEGQLQQLLADDNFSPLVSIFKQATDEVVSNPSCANPNAFVSMAKQAQVADILYMNNLQTGSILDYTLAYLGAVLARVREKWDQPSKTGLIEITTSREYYRIYSGFQFHNLQGLSPGLQASLPAQNQQSPTEGDSFQERYGDGVAWGGCTIVYLLGQETRFELLDFSYHVLAVAESDTLPTSLAYIEMMAKGTTSYSVEVTAFLENARRARRLNSHVFSLLRARAPQEDKLASMIKPNGTLVHRIKYSVTPSVYITLPQV